MARTIINIGSALIPLGTIVVVAWINASHSGISSAPPPWILDVATVSGLHQDWNVFAPRPSPIEGWVTMPAVLSDGSTRDVYRDVAPRSQRWGRMVFNITKVTTSPKLTDALAAFVCRAWNGKHGPLEIQTLSIELYERRIPLPGDSELPVERAVVWSGSCSSTL